MESSSKIYQQKFIPLGVRIFAIILSTLIFLSSTNLGKAAGSFMNAMHDKSTMSCCSVSIDGDLDCSGDEQEQEACCEDDCHCTCCVHIVFYKEFFRAFAQKESYDLTPDFFLSSYLKDYEYSIFHPPLV